MSTRRTLYILDGHALAYRHHFAMINNKNPFKTSSGEFTGATYGFTRTLIDILTKDNPHYLAVAFDEGLSGRDVVYGDYKGTRSKMPDELESQIMRIRQVVETFNIPILSLPGYEADDLIGTVALQAEAHNVEVIIFTGDRDMLQLLSDHVQVRLFIPKASTPDEIYDVARFRAKYGLEPIQLIDIKALQGDTSDNIPGVAGIGEKGAANLLQVYPNIEAIYENIALITGTTQKKLIAGRESAFMSKYLATIQRNVPFTFEIEACVALDFDKQGVLALFKELEFKSFGLAIDKLMPSATPTPPVVPVGQMGQMSMFGEAQQAVEAAPDAPIVPYRIIQTPADLRELVATLARATVIAFDTETTSLDQMSGELVGISLAVKGDLGYYIPVGHHQGEQLPLTTVIDALRPALTDPAIAKIAHNASFDLIILQRYGIDVSPITLDTMLLAWVKDTFIAQIGLKDLVAARLHLTMTPIKTLIGTGKNQITMAAVPIERAAPYAAADAACTLQLSVPLTRDLDELPFVAHDPLWHIDSPPTPRAVLEDLEMPLIPVLASMQRTGILLDVRALHQMSIKLGDIIQGLEQEVYSLTGGYGEFNLNSPKQLSDVLFGKLDLSRQNVPKTTLGYSTAADVLEGLLHEHPIIEKILEYRELTKLKGTYVDALPALIQPDTGRVHTSYNQAGAGTGRLSSSNPNLQNIPIRTEIGREVRRAFIAPEGMRLLSVDYSQVELRIMAHISEDATLLSAFEQGQDIHAATAAAVNNIPLEQVTKDQRSFAKRVNFGLLYGMGAYRLSRDSDLTLGQANDFIKTYFERLPGVKQYLDNAKQIARDQGYLTTLFGRRRSFPALQQQGANKNTVGAAEREAINMPIQGTAADIMKKAMIELYAALRERGSGARMLLQVHDEIVLEVPEDQVRETAALVVQVMESAILLKAPLRANAAVGMNWRDTEAVV